MPDENDHDDVPPEDSSVIKELRRKAEDADKAEKENAELRTKLALIEAGLGHLSDTQRKGVLAIHEGDLSPEALRKSATDLGVYTEAPPEPQVPADEQAAHGRMAAATGGAEPSDAHAKTLADEIRLAKTEAELDAILARENMIFTGEGTVPSE